MLASGRYDSRNHARRRQTGRPERHSGKATGAPLVSIDSGAAFAIFDNLEVGVNNHRLGSTTGQAMFPIAVAPRGTFGDSGFSFQHVARNPTGGSFRDSGLAFPAAVTKSSCLSVSAAATSMS
ncbi:MAG: hypothetical protein OEN21_16010 [Myxococcales bacterium]|nr:hypothetical protein [Myxococcales bacterium]